MNPGDLLFVSGTGWIARMIKLVTKSRWSHVAVYMGNGNSMEAQALRTVGLQSITLYSLYNVLPLPTISPDRLTKGLEWLLQQQGRHYSYWSDLVILVRCMFGVPLPWSEGDAIICSRLSRDFLYQCGFPVPDEDMSPEDLYEWIVNFSSHISHIGI